MSPARVTELGGRLMKPTTVILDREAERELKELVRLGQDKTGGEMTRSMTMRIALKLGFAELRQKWKES